MIRQCLVFPHSPVVYFLCSVCSKCWRQRGYGPRCPSLFYTTMLHDLCQCHASSEYLRPYFLPLPPSISLFDTSTWLPHRPKTNPWLPIPTTPTPWPNFLMTFSNFPILLVSSTTIHPVAKAKALGLILEVELFLAHQSQTMCKFCQSYFQNISSIPSPSPISLFSIIILTHSTITPGMDRPKNLTGLPWQAPLASSIISLWQTNTIIFYVPRKRVGKHCIKEKHTF